MNSYNAVHAFSALIGIALFWFVRSRWPKVALLWAAGIVVWLLWMFFAYGPPRQGEPAPHRSETECKPPFMHLPECQGRQP
jgi:hypothetical protein